MLVTKLFIIGNTTVPSSWVALLTAFLVTYCAIRFRYGKHVSGIVVDALFYFVIVWKLSVIITDFNNVIKSPLSLIYFNGGQIGYYLGLFAAMALIFIEFKKGNLHKLERLTLFISFVLIQAVYQLMMVLLNEGAFIAKFMTVIMFFVFSLFVWMFNRKLKDSLVQLALLFMAMHFFTASFQPAGLIAPPVIGTVLFSMFFIIFVLIKGTAEEFKEEGPA